MARLSISALTLGLIAVLVVGVTSAAAATAVSIEPKAKVVEGGAAVVVRLVVTCDPGLETLEANLSVSQDEASGFTGFGGFSCTGRPERLRVRVPAQDGTFDRGEAFASVFILRIDPNTQQTEQGQDSRTVRVR
jgi:hypothetical protein